MNKYHLSSPSINFNTDILAQPVNNSLLFSQMAETHSKTYSSPPESKRPNLFEYIDIHQTDEGFLSNTEDEASFCSTDHLPGSDGKVQVLVDRVLNGLPLWHSKDALTLMDAIGDEFSSLDELEPSEQELLQIEGKTRFKVNNVIKKPSSTSPTARFVKSKQQGKGIELMARVQKEVVQNNKKRASQKAAAQKVAKNRELLAARKVEIEQRKQDRIEAYRKAQTNALEQSMSQQWQQQLTAKQQESMYPDLRIAVLPTNRECTPSQKPRRAPEPRSVMTGLGTIDTRQVNEIGILLDDLGYKECYIVQCACMSVGIETINQLLPHTESVATLMRAVPMLDTKLASMLYAALVPSESLKSNTA